MQTTNQHIAQSSFIQTANTCSSNTSEKSVLLETGRAHVSSINDDRLTLFVRFLFDGGSQRTYMTSALKERLQLPIFRTERLMVKAFGGHESYFKEIEVVQLKIKTYGGGSVYIEALVIPIVCSPLPNQRPKSVKLQYEHIKNLFLSDFADDPDMSIDILIGGDYYWSFMSGKIIRGENGETPVALQTRIGWVLSGPYSCPHREDTRSLFTVSLNASVENHLEETLRRFWEVESIDSDGVLNQFNTDVEFNGERYVVKLPFKPHH